jgi:hypothetical protein
MPVIKEPDEPLAPVFDMGNNEAQKSLVWTAFSNMFKLRQEEGGTIIYHKHWFVLLQQAARPLGAFLFLLTLFFIQLWRLYNDPLESAIQSVEKGGFSPDTILVTLLFFMFLAFLWMGYEYWDWSNDIFMVTPEEIMDLDRKPLGTEERRTAQIESILSTEYKRVGLLGNILNYGTVFISVGGAKLTFQDVLDPAGVMSDINRRRMARLAKKSEEAASIDRERMATWVAAYHQNRDEFNASASPLASNLTGAFRLSDDDIDGQIDDMMDDGMADDGDGGGEG